MTKYHQEWVYYQVDKYYKQTLTYPLIFIKDSKDMMISPVCINDLVNDANKLKKKSEDYLEQYTKLANSIITIQEDTMMLTPDKNED